MAISFRILFAFLFISINLKAQVYRVYFETDQSAIQQKFFPTLDSAVAMSANGGEELLISCHCDNRADSLYNNKLSMRRALAVQNYLQQKGVRASMQVVGFGESNPMFPNTAELRYKNRRCDIKLSGFTTPSSNSSIQDFTNADVEKLVPGSLLKLDGLEFVGNQAVPNYYSMPILYKVLETMQIHPQLEIKLKGHVCCDDDLPLSIARAKAVYDFLVANGIAKERMAFEGFSNTQPIVKEVDDATQQQNRRVEMFVVKTGSKKSAANDETENFSVSLREVDFRPNTKILESRGNYNLALLAEMIANSNDYLYVLEVYAKNKALVGQRRSQIESIMRRKGISKNKLVIIPGRNSELGNEDILTLEVKRMRQ